MRTNHLLLRGEAVVIRFLCAAVLFAIGVAPAAAATVDCPTLHHDDILELLRQAPTCEKSLVLFEACSHGTSGDVELSKVVIRKCESNFLIKLSKSQRQAYDQQQKRCSRKYQNEDGTLYRSFEAFCSAVLARDYTRRYVRAPKSKS